MRKLWIVRVVNRCQKRRWRMRLNLSRQLRGTKRLPAYIERQSISAMRWEAGSRRVEQIVGGGGGNFSAACRWHRHRPAEWISSYHRAALSSPAFFRKQRSANTHASRQRMVTNGKKVSYRRETARCVVLVEILPIATKQYRKYTCTTSPE